MSTVCGFVNAYTVVLTNIVETVLKKGPQFCINVKPSEVDICACLHIIAEAISDVSAKSGLLGVSMARMNKIVDGLFGVDIRNFNKLSR